MNKKNKILFLLFLIFGFLVQFNIVFAEQKLYHSCEYEFTTKTMESGAANATLTFEGVQNFEIGTNYDTFSVSKGAFKKSLTVTPSFIPACGGGGADTLKGVINNGVVLLDTITKKELFVISTCKLELCHSDNLNECVKPSDWKNLWAVDGEDDDGVFEIKNTEDKLIKLKTVGGFNAIFNCVSGCTDKILLDTTDGLQNEVDLKIEKGIAVGEYEVIVSAKFSNNWCSEDIFSNAIAKDVKFFVFPDCNKILTGEDVTNCEGNPGLCETKCKKDSGERCEFKDNKCQEVLATESETAGSETTESTASTAKTIKSPDEIQAYYEGAYLPPKDYTGALPPCAFSGTCRNVNDLLQLIINFGSGMFAIIGSFAFAFFVYGGFTIVTSFGNAERVKKGKDIMVAAVVGLVIALSAYLLIDFMLDALDVSDTFKAKDFQ